MDLYAPQNAIIQRLEERLKARFGLREIYSDVSLADVTADAIKTPAIAVTTAPFQIRDVDVECRSTLIETRWQVVAIAPAGNDQGRAIRARATAGDIVVEIIRHLSAWVPATGYGPLLLRRAEAPRQVKAKVFIPLLFGATTTIESVD